jgi:hypothetical protein
LYIVSRPVISAVSTVPSFPLHLDFIALRRLRAHALDDRLACLWGRDEVENLLADELSGLVPERAIDGCVVLEQDALIVNKDALECSVAELAIARFALREPVLRIAAIDGRAQCIRRRLKCLDHARRPVAVRNVIGESQVAPPVVRREHRHRRNRSKTQPREIVALARHHRRDGAVNDVATLECLPTAESERCQVDDVGVGRAWQELHSVGNPFVPHANLQTAGVAVDAFEQVDPARLDGRAESGKHVADVPVPVRVEEKARGGIGDSGEHGVAATNGGLEATHALVARERHDACSRETWELGRHEWSYQRSRAASTSAPASGVQSYRDLLLI